jgi:hypothetical protein
MATWYTDVANVQQQYNNFPGAPGQVQIVQPPFWQNNPLFEGPPEIVATYVMTGSEAANDIINIAVLGAGWMVDPNGKIATGLTAPTSGVLTLAIGDNDLGLMANLPISNAAGAAAAVGQPATTLQAPVWVSGTSYVPGNVVLDATSVPANEAFTCLVATSGTTAPSSAANTTWMPNRQRYSNSIVCNTAALNVAFSGGTQNYGTPPSVLPQAVSPGVAISGYIAASTGLFQQYQIQNDCWLQAKFLTLTATIAANSVLVFRVPVITSN